MVTRERQLAAILIGLADTLVSDYDLTDYVDKLLTASTTVLDSTAGGVLLRTGDEHTPLELLAYTGTRMDVVELFQLQRHEGPCIDSVVTGSRVVESDLAACARWPAFTELAIREDYRSVIAFPLRLRGQVLGALNVFWNEPGRAADDDVGTVQAFADMATIGILQERALQQERDLTGHLQTALDSRVVIEQAKGVLAERADLDMVEAFETLRGYSRNTNRRIRDVAAAVIAREVSVATIIVHGRRRANRRRPQAFQ